MAQALQHRQTALVVGISTTGAAGNEPVPATAGSGRADAIISLTLVQKAVRPLVRTLGALGRSRLSQCADWLVVGVAFSLPWSTSATSILIGLWLIAFLPTLHFASLQHKMKTAAGGLPILLFLLGVIGIEWASVPWF